MEPRIVSPETNGASSEGRQWNWVPLAVAVVLVSVVVVAGLVMSIRGKRNQDSSTLSTAPDPYAANLPITNLAMSESSNLAGGKVTYLDGHIANIGGRTVTDIVVLVIFRNYAKEIAQSERVPLTLIRMREPYIDTAPVSTSPLKPGAQQDFRLNFDAVTPDWSGAIPEIRIVHVVSK
jgi:hypothetical protein